MGKPVILIVDNHLEFLATRSELVEAAGYTVLTAQTPDEARTFVSNRNNKIDLAVVDLRLHNDDDPEDETGIFLAAELRSLIPVILYTDFASVATARAALRPNELGESIAVDYVDKNDGPGVLINAIKNCLEKHRGSGNTAKESGKIWKIVRITVLAITIIAVFVLVIFGSKSDRAFLIATLVLAGLQIVYSAIKDIFIKT